MNKGNIGIEVSDINNVIAHRQATRMDYVLPDNELQFFEYDNALGIRREGRSGAPLPLTDHAVRQIATYNGVPSAYASTLAQNDPALLSTIFNRHGESNEGSDRIMRVVDSKVEAFLSTRYRAIDNHEIIDSINPLLEKGYELQASNISDTHFSVKFISPKSEQEVSVGDPVQTGISISNSEVGAGSLRVEGFVYRLICTNGMIVPKLLNSFRQVHLGEFKRMDFLNAITAVEAGSMDVIEQFKIAQTEKITGDIEAVLEATGKALGLNKELLPAIQEQLVGDNGMDLGLTRYALVNAITATARDQKYGASNDLEVAGGELLALSPKAWEGIAVAS